MTPQELLDDHFRRPRNIGKLLNASAVGDVGSIVAGDAMRFYITVEQERIRAAKFQVFNCADQVAAASVVTELAVGLTLDAAKKLTVAAVQAALGDCGLEHLPPQIWALAGLRTAIATLEGSELACDNELEPLVCRCHGVTEATVRRVIAAGAHTVEALVAATGAGTGCGSCKPDLVRLLDEVLQAPEAAAPVRPGLAGRIQTLRRIQHTYETDLAPSLREHQAGLELWDFDGKLVRVRLQGSLISDESAARQALTALEQLLKTQVDQGLGVAVG